jgi:tungstate transport system substrate-binding protein
MTSMARVFISALLIFCTVTAPARSDEFIVVQSTTSTENSGLFAHLLPLFTKKTGIEVRVVAVGRRRPARPRRGFRTELRGRRLGRAAL